MPSTADASANLWIAQAGPALRQGDTLQALEHTVKDFVAPGVDMVALIHVAQNQVLSESRRWAVVTNNHQTCGCVEAI